jgi:hypothetical protein
MVWNTAGHQKHRKASQVPAAVRPSDNRGSPVPDLFEPCSLEPFAEDGTVKPVMEDTGSVLVEFSPILVKVGDTEDSPRFHYRGDPSEKPREIPDMVEGHAADNHIVTPSDSPVTFKIDQLRFHIVAVCTPDLFVQDVQHPCRAVGCRDAVHSRLEQERYQARTATDLEDIHTRPEETGIRQCPEYVLCQFHPHRVLVPGCCSRVEIALFPAHPYHDPVGIAPQKT